MSVFDGEMDLKSVYMIDYGEKACLKLTPRKEIDDNCLIVGVGRDTLKPRDVVRRCPDFLCPMDYEYYKNAMERIKNDYPKIAKTYLTKDIDPTPIEHEIQDLKRTEYLIKYCSRELPFMSVNLARRAQALQTFRLPDDIVIPDTSQKFSYRPPNPDKYAEHPSAMSMKPKIDNTFRDELRRILRVKTGDTTYDVSHGLLGKVVQENNPFGPAREEPKYGRWKNRYMYTYRI